MMYVLSDNLCPSQQLQMILLRFSSFHFQLKYHCLQEAFLSKPVHLRMQYLRCGEKWFNQMHTAVPSLYLTSAEIFSQTQVEM